MTDRVDPVRNGRHLTFPRTRLGPERGVDLCRFCRVDWECRPAGCTPGPTPTPNPNQKRGQQGREKRPGTLRTRELEEEGRI